MKRKKIIVSVINDLATDQRVAKVCGTLHNMNFEVVLRGRILKDSLPVNREYRTIRVKHFFNRSFLFYAEFNIRLFFYLLFNKADVLLANDLDTLAANQIIGSIKNTPVVFDSHEYFTEVPEIQNKPLVKRIWKKIEQIFLPKTSAVITVNNSIARLFEEEYHRKIYVVRNLPRLQSIERNNWKKPVDLPTTHHILILQGSGINVDRGAEELVEAMVDIENSILFLIGGGDVIPLLKKMVIDLNLSDKVFFKPKMPYSRMMEYTRNADLGFTLDKDKSINYRYSLSNKIFDYLAAGVPVFASNLPEIRAVIEKYDVGFICENIEPKEIARTVNKLLNEKTSLTRMKNNTAKAIADLNWESEQQVIQKIFNRFV